MTNTRISMAEAYDNKDVIQQILLMKDTVRNGTYADLNVERGTGADIGKIVFDFTLTSGEHQIFKVDDKAIASTSAAQVGTTVTVTVTYNDGTHDTFTFSTLIGAMTLDTAQTATAKKTFSAGIATAGVDDTGGIDTTGDLSVGGDAEVSGQMQIGSNLAIEDSSSDSVLSSAGAIKLIADHVEAGSRAYNPSNTSDVATIGTLDAYPPMLRTTGNFTKTGTITALTFQKFAGFYERLNAGTWIIARIPAPNQTIICNALVASRASNEVQLLVFAIATSGTITVTDHLNQSVPQTFRHLVKDDRHYIAVDVVGNNQHYMVQWLMCRTGGTFTFLDTLDLPLQADGSYTDVNA